MNILTSDSVVNYANFINEVYKLTHKAPTVVSMQKLIRKHHVATTVCTKLQEEGVLRRGHKNTYRWMGPAPTPEFIAKMRNKTLEYHRAMSKNPKTVGKDQLKMDLAPETQVNPIVTPVKRKSKKTFSLFWGMIKFNY